MNLWDILILLLVAAMVLLALRAIRKGRAGGCHNGCSHCAQSCSCTKKGENETARKL